RIDSSTDLVTLNVAQVLALGTVVLTAADVVTLADTGAKLAALTPAGLATLGDSGANLAALSTVSIGALAGKGVDRIDATDNALSLSVAQALALGMVGLTAADVVTLADTGAHLKALSAAQIAVLAKCIDIVDASDNALTLSVA